MDYCHKHHNHYDTDYETECPHCVDEQINKEETNMEIIEPEYRKNIISHCCKKPIYKDTIECSGCLEESILLIKEPIAFHQWLLVSSEHDKTKLIVLLRNEIIQNQNKEVFELMDMIDMGEQRYDSKTLERVANLLMDTKFQHSTSLDDETLIIKQDKKIEYKPKNNKNGKN